MTQCSIQMFIYELLPTELKRNSFRHTDYGSQHMHTHCFICTIDSLKHSYIHGHIGHMWAYSMNMYWRDCWCQTRCMRKGAHCVSARAHLYTHTHLRIDTYNNGLIRVRLRQRAKEKERDRKRQKRRQQQRHHSIFKLAFW